MERPPPPAAARFSADWLRQREPFDAAARDAAVPRLTLAARLAPLRPHAPAPWRVIDLACGTGANLRWLAPRLGGAQEWLVVDHDMALLQGWPAWLAAGSVVDRGHAACGAPRQASLHAVFQQQAALHAPLQQAPQHAPSLHAPSQQLPPNAPLQQPQPHAPLQQAALHAPLQQAPLQAPLQHGPLHAPLQQAPLEAPLHFMGPGFEAAIVRRHLDLAQRLESLPWQAAHLVTASALLDLVSAAWLQRLVTAGGAARAALLFALTVDGRLRFAPRDAHDTEVAALFGAHQQRDKGFGPALGPRAAPALVRALRAAGYRVHVARSDWWLDGRRDAQALALLRALVDGIAAAACEQDAGAAGMAQAWRRRRQALAPRSTLRVGHLEVLALPPRR